MVFFKKDLNLGPLSIDGVFEEDVLQKVVKYGYSILFVMLCDKMELVVSKLSVLRLANFRISEQGSFAKSHFLLTSLKKL